MSFTSEQSTTAAAVKALGRARAFNRQRISQRAGVIAAIPVAGMLSLGLALGNPTDSVIMGVGAMLVGVAWRAGDGPQTPPVGTMAADAVMLAVATVAGTLTGHWEALHLIVLAGLCLLAGVATSLGRGGLLVGTQTIIAFVVFGRFPESLPNAFGLAGLVLAGGSAQVLFAAAVALPLAWRRQREALAAAYLSLAALAGQSTRPSAAAAAALDAASSVLGTPAIFADPELEVLVDLAATGRRIRLELVVLESTLGGLRAGADEHQADEHQADEHQADEHLADEHLADEHLADEHQADAALGRLRGALTMIVAAIEGAPGAAGRLAAEVDALADWDAGRAPLADARLDERVAALTGQIGAAARAAAALGDPRSRMGMVPAWLPALRPTLGHVMPLSALREDIERMRANAALDSAAGRHAIRLAVTVAGVELLTQVLALPRGYWAVVAAATVLRPGFGATFTRGAERMLGTLAGVVIATLIAVLIDPSGWGLVAVVALLSYGTYAVFPASFAVGVAMQTAVIVFVLHVAVADTTQTALYRGLDTVIGGVIGLAVYALWPTWAAHSSARLLANLIDAQRDYLQAVIAVLCGRSPLEQGQLRALARRARIAWTDAQAAATLARSEPRQGEIDAGALAQTLAALRRVAYAIHALRLAAEGSPAPAPAELIALGDGLTQALALQARSLRGDGPAAPPVTALSLRHLYRAVDWPAQNEATARLRPVLDELVDAVNTAAASLGAGTEERNLAPYDGFEAATP